MELNAFLQPVGSPITVSNLVDGYQFDFNYDRSSITNTKVRTISADKIAAGTVTVLVGIGTTATGYLRMDGGNNRLVVNDGTVDRGYFGYQENGY